MLSALVCVCTCDARAARHGARAGGVLDDVKGQQPVHPPLWRLGGRLAQLVHTLPLLGSTPCRLLPTWLRPLDTHLPSLVLGANRDDDGLVGGPVPRVLDARALDHLGGGREVGRTGRAAAARVDTTAAILGLTFPTAGRVGATITGVARVAHATVLGSLDRRLLAAAATRRARLSHTGWHVYTHTHTHTHTAVSARQRAQKKIVARTQPRRGTRRRRHSGEPRGELAARSQQPQAAA